MEEADRGGDPLPHHWTATENRIAMATLPTSFSSSSAAVNETVSSRSKRQWADIVCVYVLSQPIILGRMGGPTLNVTVHA